MMFITLMLFSLIISSDVTLCAFLPFSFFADAFFFSLLRFHAMILLSLRC